MSRIYLSPPDLAGTELQVLSEALSSGWIAPLGPHVDAFEAAICEQVAMPYAVALSSGTAALHLALAVSGVTAGDEVWLPSLTFVATANAVLYLGATPVFFDSEATTWNLDPHLLAEALDHAAQAGKLPRVVIAVDLYGQCAELEPIAAACRKHGVTLIEDAAEALGATYRGAPAGSFGDLSILSFNGNKIITTSGGGMLLGRDHALVQRARHLATQAREPVSHYEHREVGYNYRLSNLLAAVGGAQLRDLSRRVEVRREHHAYYCNELGKFAGWTFLGEGAQHRSTFWLTCATVDPGIFGAGRDVIIAQLAKEDIEARPVWKPMHMQPMFEGARMVGGRVGEALFRDGICLPSGSNMTAVDRDRVVATIRSTVEPCVASIDREPRARAQR